MKRIHLHHNSLYQSVSAPLANVIRFSLHRIINIHLPDTFILTECITKNVILTVTII